MVTVVTVEENLGLMKFLFVHPLTVWEIECLKAEITSVDHTLVIVSDPPVCFVITIAMSEKITFITLVLGGLYLHPVRA